MMMNASEPLYFFLNGQFRRMRNAGHSKRLGGLMLAIVWAPGCFAPSAAAAGQTEIPGPWGSGEFGASVTVLSSGNVVITDPGYDAPGPVADVGAVYLYDGATLAMISRLTGTAAHDRVGAGGVTALSNGNFLALSADWHGGRGAVTLGGGISGVNGIVSEGNSLVGGSPGDRVGEAGKITLLPGGNFLVSSPAWKNEGLPSAGAVTWGSGTDGVRGEVSEVNSLVGGSAFESVGSEGITVLSNGNYVVRSPRWDLGEALNVGAVIWGDGAVGVRGVVSTANSLTGDYPGDAYAGSDSVGAEPVIPLPGGNYLVCSPLWNRQRGAVTWCDGAAGLTGPVSELNSLVGALSAPLNQRDAEAGDQVGTAVKVLTNGNYVAHSPGWNRKAAAATWGDGASGVRGMVSEANSLVGTLDDGQTKNGSVTALANGNYVVLVGSAVIWGDGLTGYRGRISAGAYLSGGGPVTALSNGHYVVANPSWNRGRGAVKWCDGTVPATGTVSAANSLTGGLEGYQVGGGWLTGITVLRNGNYVVSSPKWGGTPFVGGNRGAVTWCVGTAMTSKVVSETNSLVGAPLYRESVGEDPVLALDNGNYVVPVPKWGGASPHRGAVTWGDGSVGVSGVVSPENSLVGSQAGDAVGWESELPLGKHKGLVQVGSANYIVRSPRWNQLRGAVTWGSGTAGVKGEVSAANSLVGSSPGDQVGIFGHSRPVLSNGNYVVNSPFWANGGAKRVGAATWGDGAAGVRGPVSVMNSLVGGQAHDLVGDSITLLGDGNYISRSRGWANGTLRGAGVAVLGVGTGGTLGLVTAADGIAGILANEAVRVVYGYDQPNSRMFVGSPAANRVVFFGYVPEIAVRGRGVEISDGDSTPTSGDFTDFGPAFVNGSAVTRVFTVSNTGRMPLNLTAPGVVISGLHAGDFTVTAPPPAVVAGADSVPFQITFTSGGTGMRTAKVSIASNDSNESAYEFAIQGAGADPAIVKNWRTAYFAEAEANTGDLEDYDSDGVPNLIEFAFGTHPAMAADGPSTVRFQITAEGASVLTAPGQPTLIAAALPLDLRNLRALFTRRSDFAAAGLTWIPQFSGDLQIWVDSRAEIEVLADNGTEQLVSVPYPDVENVPFFRLRVSLLAP